MERKIEKAQYKRGKNRSFVGQKLERCFAKVGQS
jgi:hypothetical protein